VTNKKYLAVVVVIIILGLVWVKSLRKEPISTITPSATPSIIPTTQEKKMQFAEPVAQFKQRITKKFFGTYVTPQNSPVSPEKFKGFHTGVDAEYQDVKTDVKVFAIADGVVETSRYASGYGGVMVIKVQISGQDRYVIYGHLRVASMLKVGEIVKNGQQIAVLGTGYSNETDGERRHLHLGIAKTNTIKGYVNTKEELNNWLDPLELYKD